MTFFAQYHRRALEQDGYIVLAPTDPIPLPIYDDATAVQYVRARGHTVIKTPPLVTPRKGERWVPTRGKGAARDQPLAEPRWVRSVGLDAMSYALQRDGWPIKIDMASWHRWVRKTRAVVG